MKKYTAKRVTIYVDAETYKHFQIYAIKVGRSVSELLDEFMKETINKKD